MDRTQRYIGLLTITRANDALRAGINRLDLGLGYVDQGYEAVNPDTTFDVLIPLAMGSNFPIPVTDGDNKLVGEIHRSALAEALAETSTADADYEANAAANAALAAEAEAEALDRTE